MKIFIDTADLDEIREAYSWGIVDGITTNPSLIRKAVSGLKDRAQSATIDAQIRRILETAGGTPVSLEVIGTSEEAMVREGGILYDRFNDVAGNVVVKIPVNPSLEDGGGNAFDGLKAIRRLADRGIPVNTTLIFTAEQALLAAKAGAAYVSPFAGRVDDDLRARRDLKFGKSDYFPEEGLRDEEGALLIEDNGVVSGIDLVAQCVRLFDLHELDCEVLAASIRNPRQAREAALAGAHVATLPFDVIQGMIHHRKTREGMAAFMKDVVPEYRAIFDGK